MMKVDGKRTRGESERESEPSESSANDFAKGLDAADSTVVVQCSLL